jgi:hypothetical protein
MPRLALLPRDNPLRTWLRDARWAMRQHRTRTGAWANPLRPRSFNDHIMHRLLLGRRPLHRLLNDKFAIRAFIEERVGPGHTVPLLHATEDPADIPWDRLPRDIVLKASHGSAWVNFVADPATADHAAIAAEVQGWMRQSHYRLTREWGYGGITPRLLIEPRIAAPPGQSRPVDHKTFLFQGRIACVLVVRRWDHENRITSALFDRHGRQLPARFNSRSHDGVEAPAASVLDQLAWLGARVGAGLDFLGMDGLLDPASERVLLNELTVYPLGGHGRFEPRAADHWLGACWRSAARGLPFPEPRF